MLTITFRCIAMLLFIQASSAVAQHCALNVPLSSLQGQRPVEISPSVPPGTCGFLQFAWQDFLALNWAPLAVNSANSTGLARGLPDPSKIIGQGGTDSSTVWEQFQPNWYLFWRNNPPPNAVSGDSFAAWNQDAWLPAACGPLKSKLPPGSPPPHILSSLSKFDAMPGVAQAFAAPLIDQEGRYLRYEILLDYQAFNYVNSNQFYLLSNLQTFEHSGHSFQFPVQAGNLPGATFIKAAWKVLTPAEIDSHRFHTVQAFLFTPGTAPIGETCAGPVIVGLVGLHIVQKTQGFPEYLWATFEQVDNTPDDPGNAGSTPPEGWSFFQPGSSKPPNEQPRCPDGVTPLTQCDFQPTSTHLGVAPNDKSGGPVQVKRLNTIPKSQNQPALSEINTAVHEALIAIDPHDVWQFYQLVEAQWQSGAPAQPPCTRPSGFFPACNVANSTMETYLQQNNSCMSCHKNLSHAPTNPQVQSDLTFELNLAWGPTPSPGTSPSGITELLKKLSTHSASSQGTPK